jgi:hypothetical protein
MVRGDYGAAGKDLRQAAHTLVEDARSGTLRQAALTRLKAMRAGRR